MCHTVGAPTPFPHLAFSTPFTRAGMHAHTHTHTHTHTHWQEIQVTSKGPMDDDIWELSSEPAIHVLLTLW